MEIIARFPALDPEVAEVAVSPLAPAVDPEDGPADPPPPPSPPPPVPAPRPPRRIRGSTPAVAFPVRSVVALAAVAVAVWCLALKNDSLRRQAERMAEATAGSVAR